LPASVLAVLLAAIDEAYDRRSWHGTSLRGSVRGLTPARAAWRPARGRHNIHELVVHAAYWKYAVRRRLTRGKRGSFPLKGSNWFERAGAGAAAWRADVALLDSTHRALREAIASLPESALDDAPPGTTATNRWLIAGIAAHDLYHAGQIQLIKRLMPRNL
jgi:hypothetical protein